MANDDVEIVEIISFIIATCGYLIRWWTCRELGEFFTFDIGVKENHKLIETGPYKWVVHPSYTSQLLCLWGTLFYMHVNVAFVSVFMGYACYIVSRRDRIEEEAMLKSFSNYQSYVSQRWRYIPFIY